MKLSVHLRPDAQSGTEKGSCRKTYAHPHQKNNIDCVKIAQNVQKQHTVTIMHSCTYAVVCQADDAGGPVLLSTSRASLLQLIFSCTSTPDASQTFAPVKPIGSLTTFGHMIGAL